MILSNDLVVSPAATPFPCPWPWPFTPLGLAALKRGDATRLGVDAGLDPRLVEPDDDDGFSENGVVVLVVVVVFVVVVLLWKVEVGLLRTVFVVVVETVPTELARVMEEELDEDDTEIVDPELPIDPDP